LSLYWEIGYSIVEHQQKQGWGSKIVELLDVDLAKSFPESKDFSLRNLKYMRAFAEAYPEFPIVQVPLAQITRVKELEIEKLLTQKITDFLLELGKGFAFVARQFPIEVDHPDYKIDLLFYHTILHAYVVIELKAANYLKS